MAYKRKSKKDSKPERSSVDNLALELRDAAIRELGQTKVLAADTFLDMVNGLPLTGNIPLQHMLGVDVLALGRTMTLVGPSGSSKSSLGWYLAQQFLHNQGLVMLFETENKTNPDQVRAIIDDDELFNRVTYVKCNTLNKLFSNLIFFVKQYEKHVPNKDVPMMLFIDSLGAITTDEAREKADKDDSDNYQGARNASAIQNFLQTFIPEYVEPNPIMLVVVNHQKIKIDQKSGPFAPTLKREPGGDHKEFLWTWKLEMAKGPVKKSVKGITPVYRLKSGKSSLGPSYKHSLEVPYTSNFTDDALEHISYDWDEALTNLLANPIFSATLIKDIVGFKKNGNKYSSSVLGLKDVSASELGKAIHADEKMTKEIQEKLLHIRRKRKFAEEDEEPESEPEPVESVEPSIPTGDD